MKKFIIFIIIITVINIIFRNQNKSVSLSNPSFTPSPTSQIETFKYDSSTDLEKELESIDPKVLDSDFNE